MTDYRPKSKAQKLLMKRDFEGIYDVCLFGSSGSGKTVALIISSLGPQKDGTLLVDRSEYRGIFLRRESVLLTRSGLIDSAMFWYRNFYPSVQYNKVEKEFTFPSGAKINFGGCERDEDKEKYKGYTELHFVGFEELTQFSEAIYDFICSRLRTSTNIPLRVRSSTNPGDAHEQWVLDRYKYWISNCVVPLDRELVNNGEILFFSRQNDKLEVSKEKGTFSVAAIETFIDDISPENREKMSTSLNDPILRAQLVDGVWGLKHSSGAFFKETYFSVVDKVPTPKVSVRYWDKACSGEKGDYLCGMKVSHYKIGIESYFVIEDTILEKPEPADVLKIISLAAEKDGDQVTVIIEKEPGSSGKEILDIYKAAIQKTGRRVLVDDKRASKIDRASSVAPLAKESRIQYLPQKNINEVIHQLVSFPDKNTHDDAVDTLSGAIYYLKYKLAQPSIFSGERKVNTESLYNRYQREGLL